jgi:hypothetical protein
VQLKCLLKSLICRYFVLKYFFDFFGTKFICILKIPCLVFKKGFKVFVKCWHIYKVGIIIWVTLYLGFCTWRQQQLHVFPLDRASMMNWYYRTLQSTKGVVSTKVMAEFLGKETGPTLVQCSGKIRTSIPHTCENPEKSDISVICFHFLIFVWGAINHWWWHLGEITSNHIHIYTPLFMYIILVDKI